MIVTLILISVFYFISSCYINTSNDGSHFALVSAIVNKHSLIVDDYVAYTNKVDYAVKNGHFYSDRLPGNAFLMIPFYAFGNALTFFHLNTLSNHVPIQEVTVIFLSNICGVLGVLFIFLFCMQFNASFKTSLVLAVLYGICTLNLQESTHVFSHVSSMCFVLMAFFYLIKTPSVYDKQFLWFVFLLSYSSIIELQNCLLFFPAIIYVFHSKKMQLNFSSENTKRIALSAFIFLATLSVLAFYNYTAFGELTLKSNKFNPEFPEEQSFLTSLSGDFVSGIDRLFTNFLNHEVWFNLELGVKNDIPGMLITSPIFFLSLVGFVLFFKKKPQEAMLFFLIIAINVLIAAFHKTVLVRHIFTITPFLFFPILFLVNYIQEQRSKTISTVFYSVFIFLAGLSCFRVFYVTHTYWGREITNLLPFTKEFNIYLVFLLLIALISFAGFKLKHLFIKS